MTIENQVISQTPIQTNIFPETNNISNEVSTTSNFDLNNFFPEDIRKDADFERLSKNFPKDLSAIAKDYYHKNKHFGKARDVIKAEIEAELSKPVSYNLEDYSYELPEGYQIENEILDVAKNKARELGIKPEIAKQFIKELFTADNQINQKLALEELDAEKKKYEDQKLAFESIKKEWGFEYENKVKKAEETLARFTSPEEHNAIANLPLEQKLPIIKMMDKISLLISEGNIGTIAQSNSKMTESDFQIKRKEIWASNKPDSLKYAEEKLLFDQFYS